MMDELPQPDPDGVNNAKRAFVAESAQLSPLNIIRRHPFAGIGTATAIGMVAGSPLLGTRFQSAREVLKFSNYSFILANKFIDGVRLALRDKKSPLEDQ